MDLWLPFVASTVTTFLTCAFFYGRLTERVGAHGRRLDVVEKEVKGLSTRVARIEGAQ